MSKVMNARAQKSPIRQGARLQECEEHHTLIYAHAPIGEDDDGIEVKVLIEPDMLPTTTIRRYGMHGERYGTFKMHTVDEIDLLIEALQSARSRVPKEWE